jgi:hypothetical protein
MSSHKTKTTSFRRWDLAEADGLRDFLLETGLKSDFSGTQAIRRQVEPGSCGIQ